MPVSLRTRDGAGVGLDHALAPEALWVLGHAHGARWQAAAPAARGRVRDDGAPSQPSDSAALRLRGSAATHSHPIHGAAGWAGAPNFPFRDLTLSGFVDVSKQSHFPAICC
eukprot:COSAG01_NODE_34_length_34978_cov_45.798475_25_plen_111_part_00